MEVKKKKKKVKKKHHKTADPTWDAVTYGSPKKPFDIEYQKYYNPVEGRDQILFLYCEKNTGKVVKYRILR